jgi:hypothetical protein
MSRDRRPVDRTSVAAVEAWANGARTLTREVRTFVEDALMPRGERRHSRTFLRKMICRRLRELDARIDAIDPAPRAPVPVEAAPAGDSI